MQIREGGSTDGVLTANDKVFFWEQIKQVKEFGNKLVEEGLDQKILLAVVAKVEKRRRAVNIAVCDAVVREGNRFDDTRSNGPDLQKLIATPKLNLDDIRPCCTQNHELLTCTAVKHRKANHLWRCPKANRRSNGTSWRSDGRSNWRGDWRDNGSRRGRGRGSWSDTGHRIADLPSFKYHPLGGEFRQGRLVKG